MIEKKSICSTHSKRAFKLSNEERILLIQALYAINILEEEQYDTREIISGITKEIYSNHKSLQKLEDIFVSIVNDLVSLDNCISKNLSFSWKIERLPKVLLAILRMAIFEIKIYPSKIGLIINNYIEITRRFEHHKEVAFLNGLLDNIGQKYVSTNSTHITNYNHSEVAKTN